MYVRALEHWAANMVLIGTLADSPSRRQFCCSGCLEGYEVSKRGRWRKESGLALGKERVTRVFPDVERVRALHQTARYVVPPTILDEDEYSYPMMAYCRMCKVVRCAWAMGVSRHRRGVWREMDGTRVLSKVTQATRAAVVEWVKRRGHEWRKGWAMRDAWKAWRYTHVKARKAEWMLEEKLAKMQIDAENTGVTDIESASLGWVEECALGVGY